VLTFPREGLTMRRVRRLAVPTLINLLAAALLGALLPAILQGATAPVGAARDGSAGDTRRSGPPASPLRVMVPTDRVAEQYWAQGYGSLADVIAAMDPVAAYSPGPRMKTLDSLALAEGSRSLITPRAFRTLAILVDFSDRSSVVSPSFFDTLVFGTAQPNTVNRFYEEASYGLVDIVTLTLPSGMGWQRAPNTMAYYTAGNSCVGDTYPRNCQKLAEDVTALVDPVVDFSRYDNDGDGWVDTVFIIHAGSGAEATGSPNDIWSHSWSTYTGPTYDGVRIGSYTAEPEYWYTPGDMTHGVFAHELAHAFGLPDLYDYDRSSEGVGAWSLMAGGSWNGTLGNSPAQFDAWSRLYLGFNDAIPVPGTGQALSLPNVVGNQAGSIYRINGANSSEYWLLENRQRLGSDAALPGDGLLIWHVDAAADSNSNECRQPANWLCSGTSNHFQVALEQADGLFHLENAYDRGGPGDPYPGTANNRRFDVGSTPNSSSYYTSASLDVTVSQISGSASTMTATVSAAATTPGAPSGVTALSGNGLVTVSWSAPPDGGAAISDYVVQYRPKGSVDWVVFGDGVSASLGAVVTGLSNGTTYELVVAATNSVGVGDWSAVAEATPVASALPGAPSAVQETPGSRAVLASWLAPSDGGAVISDYAVQYRRKGSTRWVALGDVVSADLHAHVTGLSNGTLYQFRVAAENGVGVGPWSAVTEMRAGVPTDPQSVVPTPGSRQVQLAWQAPVSNCGKAITDYVIQYRKTGTTAWVTFPDGRSTSRHTHVTRLKNGVAYQFRVAASNSRGVGMWSAVLDAQPGA
jgi:immune inhibitor A